MIYPFDRMARIAARPDVEAVQLEVRDGLWTATVEHDELSVDDFGQGEAEPDDAVRRMADRFYAALEEL